MLRLKHITFLLFILCAPVLAQDLPPSEESVKHLLEVANAQKLLDDVMKQMDGAMTMGMQQAFRGQPISPDDQKILDKFREKWISLFRREMSWEKLEPIYVKIYSETFTQKEIDDITAFYKTPTGQEFINKMPLVMKNSMSEMNGLMGPMIREIVELQKETMAEIKARHASPSLPQ